MIAQIRPAEFEQWLHSVRTIGEPLMLDVREADELRLASIQAQGFELLVIPMGLVPVRLDELDPARPIACLCHHGARSMRVASYLQDKGYAQVANIAGGIHAWSLEKDSNVPRY